MLQAPGQFQMPSGGGGPWPGQQAAALSQSLPAPPSEDCKSLWIGDLQYWMDENYLWNCFAHSGEVASVKIIRNKVTGYSEGYGFVEFLTHASALKAVQTFNGTQMPQTEQTFRLNWASFGAGEKRGLDPDHSIFVGDLANDVTDQMLTDVFRARFPSVKAAKVIVDNITGRSKGYGFVRFGSDMERDRAMSEMNGQYCGSRPMRISAATSKKASAQQTPTQSLQGGEDVTNTTVFVGGLDMTVTEEYLRQAFSRYGVINHVKIPFGKGCGFVQFQTRAQAEEAIKGGQGLMIGSQTVRLSWGRNPAQKTGRMSSPMGGMMSPGQGMWPQPQQGFPQQMPADASVWLNQMNQMSPMNISQQQAAAMSAAAAGMGGGYFAGGFDQSAGMNPTQQQQQQLQQQQQQQQMQQQQQQQAAAAMAAYGGQGFVNSAMGSPMQDMSAVGMFNYGMYGAAQGGAPAGYGSYQQGPQMGGQGLIPGAPGMSDSSGLGGDNSSGGSGAQPPQQQT